MGVNLYADLVRGMNLWIFFQISGSYWMVSDEASGTIVGIGEAW